MTTIERITQVLSQHGNGITDPQVDPEGYVHAQLANGIDSDRPYNLVVHPIEQKQVLRVWVLGISKVRRESGVPLALSRANASLRYGRASVTSDGEIQFQINHLYMPGDEAHLTAEVLGRLLDEAVCATRHIERTVLYGQMIDAGIPVSRARTIMKALFQEPAESQVTGNETL